PDCCHCFAEFRVTLRTTSARSLRQSLRSEFVMQYQDIAIKDADVPTASSRIFQHLLKTYASEVNKLNSMWKQFSEDDLSFKPHPRSTTVREIMEHELLSQRRFFGEFLGLPEVPA